MLIRTIPIIIIATIGGIVISSVNSKNKTDDINVLPYVIPLIAVSAGFGLYRGVNRRRDYLKAIHSLLRVISLQENN